MPPTRLSHSQALAGPADVFDDLCRQHGAIVTGTIRDFVETLRLLEAGIGDREGGTAFLGLSGGLRVLVSDTCQRLGITLSEFDPATSTTLDAVLGESAGSNPIDLGAAMLREPNRLDTVLTPLFDDPTLGVIAFVTHLRDEGGSPRYQELLDTFLARALDARSHGKVLVVVATTPSGIGGRNWQRCLDMDVPVLSDLSSIASLPGAKRIDVHEPPRDRRRPGAVAGLLERCPEGQPALDELIRCLVVDGIPFVESSVAASVEDAAQFAVEIGFPVAVKVHAVAPAQDGHRWGHPRHR